ncbi:phage capsid protein [Salipiger marinus]|uniref:Phage major capsid protein, HK97 family n=1 Tax=Salipiger marinus TaxID=555512 RepID=A0A1G8LM87_9RHOB|nr:phage capsid protein [Salipiger marinus]SDI56340.1 hypothetical protein SAMN04487993_1006227 [Salipiger marinus]
MSYRQVVEDHHKLTFTNNVKMVHQQMQNPLRAAVTVADGKGEAQDIADLVGAVDYIKGEDYSRRNPENPPKHSRRWLVRPEVIETGQYITKEEQFDKAMDPTSTFLQNHVKGVERGVFDTILGVQKVQSTGKFRVAGGGIMGGVYEGKTPNALVTLPAGNYIAHDLGGESIGLTAEKLRAATEGMELEDFGLESDQEIYGLISPKQKTDLINLALATKTSLNPFEVENIRNGKPGTLLGINWLFSNRVPYDSSGHRLVPIWTKENVVAAFWQDVDGRIWNDGSAKNLPYVYVDAYVNSGRVEDKGVRIIRCVEG